METLKGKLVLVAILLAIFGVVSVMARIATPPSSPQTPESELPAQTLGDVIRKGEAPIPELSASTKEKLAASKGFQAIVAYTDNGFEPAKVQIQPGQTVRFVNSSSHDVWIAAGGGTVRIYPRTKEGCGSSDLDSCTPFSPQDFWEFTFDKTGEWHVVNNLDKSKDGVIEVK